MKDERANPTSELMLETLTLAETAILFLCLTLPALIEVAAAKNDIQVKRNYLVFSVAPPPGKLNSLLDVGRDIGVYFRQDGEPDVANNFAGPDGGSGWSVDWPGLNYALMCADADVDLKLGCWLRYDPTRLADPEYVAAVREPIRIYVYGSADAADMQAALASGATPTAPLTIVLDPSNVFQVEVDLPQSLQERS